MLDELGALKTIRQGQRKWRRLLQILFLLIIALTSVLFVVFPQVLPSMLMQLIMLCSMASVFGLFFLDRLSFYLNRFMFKQDIVHKYLFQHLKPDDVHKDAELVMELVGKRRQDSKAMRSL